MLCTDGLTDLVNDAEILKILQTSQLELSPTHLINLANQRGGHDNITIVALEVPPQAEITRPLRVRPKPNMTPVPKTPRTSTSWLMVILLLMAILMMVLLLVYTFMVK
jgi:protein phosphatase